MMLALLLTACEPKDSGGAKPTETGGESGQPDTDTGRTDTGDTSDTGESGDTDSGVDTAPPPCDRSLPWKYVACGIAQTCGIHTDGCAECWGRGEEQGGDPRDTWYLGYEWNGEDIPPEGDFLSITMMTSILGYETPFACGILSDRSGVCWGSDDDVTTTVPEGPFDSMKAWVYGAYGILVDASAVGWGNGDAPAGEFTMVATGYSSALYLRTDGTLLQTPVWAADEQPSPPGTFTDIGMGDMYACAISTDGTVLCWYPDDPEDAEYEALTVDAPVGSFVDVCNMGGGIACVLDASGEARCWGIDDPLYQPPAGELFSQIACGSWHACGVTLDQRIVCWGGDVAGETTPPT